MLPRAFLIFLFALHLGCSSFDFRNLFSGYIHYEKEGGGAWIRLPLKEVDHLPVLILSMEKGREPLRFLIDTGAFVSFLEDEYVPENSPRKFLSASFPGGAVQSVRRAMHSDLFAGGLKTFENVEFFSHDFPKELRVNGILGMNAFMGLVIQLELPDRVSIWKSPSSKVVPGFLEENLFPMLLRSGQPTAVLLRPPGIRKESWILDTGAEYSVLDWDIVQGDNPTEYSEGKDASVYNFGGGKLNAKIRILKPFCPVFVKNSYEGLGFCLPELEVFPGGIPPDALHWDYRKGIVGILGRNWMENYRILLDTKRSLIGIVGKETDE
ncbi:aspartyl protease [Leptospira langatensis]|uniref:Aspartyl protease n=1 Tax=Leptospira langatensis TaxID=2484983 RepID=A0A5F1ZQW4_9LEPT|nr:aspartyl protease family protein [Leptospira langatensis]TGK05330.1 aspartyl protease [Leptospira langatensis]TGL38466.1 aspartyl protease [Leptospira langatensis]